MPAAIIPLITTAVSLGSSAVAKRKANKTEKELESMVTPTYKPNQSILDFYTKALQKYNTNITDTAEYKLQNQNVKQGTVQALSSLNKLRSGNVANVIQNQNNSLLKAAVAGEQRKAQEFGVLQQATQMKAGEGNKEFQYNQIAPFEKTYNLLAAKAGGQRQVQNAQTQNAYNNASAAASILSGSTGDGGQGNGNFNWNNLLSRKISGTNIPRNYADKPWYQGESGDWERFLQYNNKNVST